MNYNFLVEQEVNHEEILNDHLLIGKCWVLSHILLIIGSISPLYFIHCNLLPRCTQT